MGKIVGTAPSIISGSVGLYTYRQTKDGTIVSEKIKAKGVGKRTLKQCMAQLQLANLQHLFNSFGGAIEGAFENLPQRQNTRAAFMKANIGALPIYLTKPAVNFSAVVAVPVQISRGSLPTIGVTEATIPYTNINLGSLVIDANTTIAAFSQAVCNNPGYMNGDQLSYFSIIQGTRAFGDFGGVPQVTNNRYEVTLDIHDTVHKLWDFVGQYGFASVAVNGTQFLGCSAAPAVGAYAWVHSRGFGAEMKTSTQFLCANNADIIAAWSGAEALEKAALSYGGYKAQRFLEPGQTTSSVIVEEGGDISTGAIPSGAFVITGVGGVSANDTIVNRVQMQAGQANIVLFGTNMTSFNSPVALRMFSTSNGTSSVEIPATLDAETSTANSAVLKASVASPNVWLGALLVNGAAVKTFNAFGGSTGGGAEEG